MQDFATIHRRLSALVEVALAKKVTQRSLAAELGISLGLANQLLRRLEAERLVRASGATESGGYVVTPAGFKAMAAMTRSFRTQSAALLKRVATAQQREKPRGR